MQVKTQGRSQMSGADARIKHFYQDPDPAQGDLELVPFLCVEARVDFNDIRTGFRETVSLSKALEIYSDTADLLWTDDMVRDVNPAGLSPVAPAGGRLRALPDFVNTGFAARMESRFVQYLLRSFETRIYRNFDLNIYSFSGESRSDFCQRCLELFDAPKRDELYALHEVFMRKLEQIRQKYLGAGEPDGEELEQARKDSTSRDALSRCSERIADLFYRAEEMMDLVISPHPYPSAPQEYEEKLIALEREAQQAVVNLTRAYEEKANAIDEYIIHPNLKDIHLVRSCVVWMPGGTA